jgi:hypothetical protein
VKRALIVLALTLPIALLAGCSDKANEQFKDSDRAATNQAPADTGTMPDGFSNYSTKCDHGNRVYVLFHADSPYGSIAVVPVDKSCAGVP